VERAVARVKETHVQVNGTWIDASDRRIPPNFPELAGDVLAEYAAKHGKAEGLGASDLTVRSFGGGSTAWRIVRRADGIPVDDQKDGVFVVGDLLRAQAARKDAENERTLRQIKDRNEPLLAIPGTSIGIGKPSLSGYSPAEVEAINRGIERKGAEAGQRIRDSAVEVGRGASAAKRKADDAQEAADAERLANPPKSIREQLGDAIGIRGKSRRK
jgi:hypothetical protein